MPEALSAIDPAHHTGDIEPEKRDRAVALLWDAGYAGSVDRDAVIAVDSLDELSRAANALAASTAQRARAGQSARAFAAANWSWDWTVQQYLDLFKASAEGCG